MARFRITRRSRSLIAGLACGLLCATCVGVYITQVDKQASEAQAKMLAEYGGEQIDVCVAKHDIAAGQTIMEGDIESRTWIATLLPANAVTDKKDAIGKQVGSTILSGEVVSTSRFGFDSSDISVPDGFVAVSVPTRDVQAVGGSLSSGMSVDIYGVGASGTALIAKKVQVLATSSGSVGSSAAAWITVAVAPEKVQELVAAAETLQIYFTLPSESASSSGMQPRSV